MNDLQCYECNKPLTVEAAFYGDDGLEAYCEKCFIKLNMLTGNIKLKCINNLNHFTAGCIYKIIGYEYNNFYIVIDDDNKSHHLTVDFVVNNFLEV
jgi:hypothetical protein